MNSEFVNSGLKIVLLEIVNIVVNLTAYWYESLNCGYVAHVKL